MARDVDIGKPKIVDGKHILVALEAIANDGSDIMSDVVGETEDE